MTALKSRATIPAICGSCKRIPLPGCDRCVRLNSPRQTAPAPHETVRVGDYMNVRFGGSSQLMPVMPYVHEMQDVNRRAQAVAAGDGGITWLSVGVRDGWVCHLCGGHVLQVGGTAAHPHGANVDHVKPIAAGGDHVWSNVAVAHRVCNMLKGATSVSSLPSLEAQAA